MFRRGGPFLVVFAALATWLSPIGPGVERATALPVATSDATYGLLGRVFPDPQGCRKGTPGASPWAKGNVCATTFLGWDETLAGLKFLQTKFPRFAQLVDVHDLKATVPEFADLDMQSAGIPKTDLTRDRKDLHVFVLTDRESKVPLADRKRFAYSLSIHGIERAGLEAGVRAAEDLVTWAATAPSTHILEPTNSGPTAGEVLADDVIYFVLSNPDGWARGDVTQAGVYYQRYNGNGADLNREFPAVGYSNPVYTPLAEPEAQGYAAYLRRERSLAKNTPFAGTFDLHGMLDAPSFSFTLMPGGARDYAANARVVQVARAVYADQTQRLSWSPLIAPPDQCPGAVPVIIPISGTDGALPMCADQWGSTWDTINYQTTNSIGDWMGSSIGLGSIGLSNEMAYSHLLPNNAFVPDVEQLHVDGNKGLIYAQIATLTNPAPVPALNVSAAYAPAVRRVTRKASTTSAAQLPAQAAINAVELHGEGLEFDVLGPVDGVHNAGMSIEATVANVQGISPLFVVEGIFIDRYGADHAGDTPGWHEVASWNVREADYLASGARIDLNDPVPGRYRVRPSTGPRVVTSVKVLFSPRQAVPTPNLAYDVANTDVFDAMPAVRPLTAATILRNPSTLDAVHSYILADDPAPGVAVKDRSRWFDVLRSFVERGGDLVLTDHALDALVPLGVVPATALTKGPHYGGWISFTDVKGVSTFGTTPLTAGLDLPGASAGDGDGLGNARQTYDPAAVGFVVSASGAGSCTDGLCDAPQEVVDPTAWANAGGVVAGRSEVLGPPKPDISYGVGELSVYLNVPPDAKVGVAYGEVSLGKGHVRIAGGLLPTPTDANEHPFGLEAQGLSWTGYQVLVNLMSGAGPAQVLGVTTIPATGHDARVPLDAAAGAIALAVFLRFVRARRRLHPLS